MILADLTILRASAPIRPIRLLGAATARISGSFRSDNELVAKSPIKWNRVPFR